MNDDKNNENYMALGMSYGLLAGAGVMTVLSTFGQLKWGGGALGICLLIGMLIGMCIKKIRIRNTSLIKEFQCSLDKQGCILTDQCF